MQPEASGEAEQDPWPKLRAFIRGSEAKQKDAAQKLREIPRSRNRKKAGAKGERMQREEGKEGSDLAGKS
jgi:hypothetical protein